MAVSMDIKVLDVNQCPGKYYTPNAFKRTHKCDDKTSYVSIQYQLQQFLIYKTFSSVFRFLGAGSQQVDTNVNANKDMSIRLRIPSTILMVRDWMLSS